jgi:hypothetical protein
MPGEIYFIKTGADNYFWKRCLEANTAALMFDQDYYEAWAANDKEAHLEVTRKHADKGASESDLKRESTTWFTHGQRLANSLGDIFICRDGNNLYWATSTEAPWYPIPHEHMGQPVVAVCKPVDGWTRFTAKGDKALKWETTHNRAKDFLQPYPALFRIDNEEMRDYLDAMLHGDDLTPWHSQSAWKIKQGEHRGKSLANSLAAVEFAVEQLMTSITQTVSQSNGQVVMAVKTMKNKELVGSKEVMRAHLKQLYEDQEGRCKLSGIQMHVPGAQDGVNPDLMISPDRIDSNGHYEAGNIQLVCRFVNYWKCATDNSKFTELLDLVIEHRKTQS